MRIFSKDGSFVLSLKQNYSKDIKIFQKILKGTELNRCKKYGDKLDEIAELV